MMKPHPNHPGTLSVDAQAAECDRPAGELGARARAIELLTEHEIPFLVGGAYGFCTYTGIYRDTKDLDLFPKKEDAARALEVLAADGWRTERTDEVWIYKAFKGEWFVDLIFSSGNGIAKVDDTWFAHARKGHVFGLSCLIAPPEELIWSKGFVLERERYDGADVIHLLRCAGPTLDWERLLWRFDRYWEVLLAHLMHFRFVYPGERSTVPDWVMVELMGRTARSVQEGDWPAKVCRGNLMSKVNYTLDLTRWGYLDGRLWDEVQRADDEAAQEAQPEAAYEDEVGDERGGNSGRERSQAEASGGSSWGPALP